MHAFVLAPDTLESFYPLTLPRQLGEIPVANTPLRELQFNTLAALGLKIAQGAQKQFSPPSLFMRGDAYISSEDLKNLSNHTPPAVLTDKADQPLAWLGNSARIPEKADRFSAEQGWRLCYPWDLLQLNEQLVSALDENEIVGEISDGVHIDGTITVGTGSRLLPGVYIEGKVMIGQNCKIGPNCYIRGNTSVGDNCHIGQAVEIKNSLIMDNVSVGHLSYCGDTIIGHSANLGAGTITANLRHDGTDHRSMIRGELVNTGRRKLGAVIGEGAHTGIHTSIYPGRKMWPATNTRPGTVVQKDIISK